MSQSLDDVDIQGGVDYDPRSGTYSFEWDDSTDADLSTILLFAVSEVSGTDPTEIEPLNEIVDVDSLDGLFATVDGVSRKRGRLTLPIEGYEVTVFANGRLTVSESGTGGTTDPSD